MLMHQSSTRLKSKLFCFTHTHTPTLFTCVRWNSTFFPELNCWLLFGTSSLLKECKNFQGSVGFMAECELASGTIRSEQHWWWHVSYEKSGSVGRSDRGVCICESTESYSQGWIMDRGPMLRGLISLRLPMEAVDWGLQLLFILSAYQKCVS